MADRTNSSAIFAISRERARRSVVIIDPAFLGDVVFDGPLVRAIRRRDAEVRVGIVVRPPGDAIARLIDGIDRVHVFDKRREDRGLSGVLRIARELRNARYDVALVPHVSPRSALVARLARIPVRIGSGDGLVARIFFTERRPATEGDTFVAARLRLLGDSVIDDELAALEGTIRGRCPPSRGPRTRVGLVLGSQWPTKRWAISQVVRFVKGLDPATTLLVLLGADGERPLYDELLSSFAAPPLEMEDAVGGTVETLVDAIARCDVVVAGDTGPLHIARALGIPVIALFGPTSERHHAFHRRDRVLSVDLACRPCSDHGGLVCPERHHRCMKELDAGLVLGALEGSRAHSTP